MYDFCLYEVSYYVSSFKGGSTLHRTATFCFFANAAYIAEKLSLANDVEGDVNIINAFTGELEATYNRGEQTYIN